LAAFLAGFLATFFFAFFTATVNHLLRPGTIKFSKVSFFNVFAYFFFLPFFFAGFLADFLAFLVAIYFHLLSELCYT